MDTLLTEPQLSSSSSVSVTVVRISPVGDTAPFLTSMRNAAGEREARTDSTFMVELVVGWKVMPLTASASA